MSDSDPFEEYDEVAPSRGKRRWLWGCGCGCLAIMAGMVALFATLGVAIHRATDPARTWALLAESLPYDEWARESNRYAYDLQFGAKVPFTDLRSFTLTRGWSYLDEYESDEDPRVGYLHAGSVALEIFDESDAGTPPRYVRVQGRDLEVRTRFWEFELLPPSLMPSHAGEAAESALLARISDPGDPAVIAVLVAPDASETPSDAELVEFLAPFHVGPDR